MNLIRGQKLKLSDLSGLLDFEVGVFLDYKGAGSMDITCFGVDQANRLSDDRYFIFYNQPASPENALRKLGPVSGDTERFRVNLPLLPGSIKKLVFTAAIDGDGAMNELSDGYIRFLWNNGEQARFSFTGRDFLSEKAVILAEVYFKDVWRLAAVGQGFNGGLGALLKHFGGEEISAPPPPPPPPPPSPKLSLSKITLEKKGDKKTVELRKKGEAQPIHINLNWDQTVKRKGSLFGSKTLQADLDLGCMFALKDGRKGVIQALGNSFGMKTDAPYIYLDKDDRSGQASDGENLFIMRPDLIDLVMIFSFIYEGTANFADVNGRVTIKDELGNEIFMRLDSPDPRKIFCSICTIRNLGEKIEVTKEEKYFTDHQDADHHYRFGFSWKAGKKD